MRMEGEEKIEEKVRNWRWWDEIGRFLNMRGKKVEKERKKRNKIIEIEVSDLSNREIRMKYDFRRKEMWIWRKESNKDERNKWELKEGKGRDN